MGKMVDQTILDKSEELLKRLEKASKFGSKYGIYPNKNIAKTAKEMSHLTESMPDIKHPKNKDELISSELKRHLQGAVTNLNLQLSGEIYDLDSILSLYGMPKTDITSLKPWLKANKNKTLESVNRLFNSTDTQNYRLELRIDIPKVARESEEFAGTQIQRIHKIIGKYLENLTDVGGFLRDVDSVPTKNERSYFSDLTKTLAVGIPAILYSTEEGILQVKNSELIRIFGHEGMGHGLNKIMTDISDLPYFLTKSSMFSEATAESVAQFYQKQILEDIKNSPEVQEKLGIKHDFDKIYRETKDMSKLDGYKQKLYQYAITVVADKNLGHPEDPKTIKKKIELLSEVALDPSYPRGMVEHYRYKFDSEGNLEAKTISELRYAAQPVQRALKEFEKRGIKYDSKNRSKIDETFLTGFWTPTGFVDNARLTT